MSRPVSRVTRLARRLRRNQTDAEQALWSRLRNRRLAGARFRRQYPVVCGIVDFACPELRLIVEVDGGQHADSASDRARDQTLASQGWRVLRFWNNDVLNKPDLVLQAICHAVLASSPQPSPEDWRGSKDSLPEDWRGSKDSLPEDWRGSKDCLPEDCEGSEDSLPEDRKKSGNPLSTCGEGGRRPGEDTAAPGKP